MPEQLTSSTEINPPTIDFKTSIVLSIPTIFLIFLKKFTSVADHRSVSDYEEHVTYGNQSCSIYGAVILRKPDYYVKNL